LPAFPKPVLALVVAAHLLAFSRVSALAWAMILAPVAAVPWALSRPRRCSILVLLPAFQGSPPPQPQIFAALVQMAVQAPVLAVTAAVRRALALAALVAVLAVCALLSAFLPVLPCFVYCLRSDLFLAQFARLP